MRALYLARMSCQEEFSDSTFGDPSSPPASASESSDTKCLEEANSPRLFSLEKSRSIALSHPDSVADIPWQPVPTINGKNSRKNTKEEIRKMRNGRKRRKRLERNYYFKSKTIAGLKEELIKERKESNKKQKEALLYKNMARSYWERWQWELQKRKEAVKEQLRIVKQIPSTLPPKAQSSTSLLHEICPDLLHDPVKSDGSTSEEYIGRGSFAVVRLQLYRGFHVAVKEFLPRSVRADVVHEATILTKLCHPYLPYLFGVCMSSFPLRIVMQFHGIGSKPLTLAQELVSTRMIYDSTAWLLLCSQLIEALLYLHTQVEIIHNDIKSNNILLADSPSTASPSSSRSTGALPLQHHIVLIDFGKATDRTHGRHYSLSEIEKVTYLTRYPHIAPEVTHGERPQSTFSDIYSLGKVLIRMIDYGCFRSLSRDDRSKVRALSESCCSIHYSKRPPANQCLKTMMSLLCN